MSGSTRALRGFRRPPVVRGFARRTRRNRWTLARLRKSSHCAICFTLLAFKGASIVLRTEPFDLREIGRQPMACGTRPHKDFPLGGRCQSVTLSVLRKINVRSSRASRAFPCRSSQGRKRRSMRHPEALQVSRKQFFLLQHRGANKGEIPKREPTGNATLCP